MLVGVSWPYAERMLAGADVRWWPTVYGFRRFLVSSDKNRKYTDFVKMTVPATTFFCERMNLDYFVVVLARQGISCDLYTMTPRRAH
jgi:hypothetical protein